MTRLIIVLLLLVHGLIAGNGLSQEPGRAGLPGVERVECDGQICLVCGDAIVGPGLLLVHRGRQVFLCSEACSNAFASSTETYFRRLQPRGALFDEEAWTASGTLNDAWLWLGLYVLAGLLFGAACSYLAVNRGQPATPWFFAGLLVNLLALAAILVWPKKPPGELEGIPSGLKKVPLTRAPVLCPACGNENHPAATACLGCGAALQPTVRAEGAGRVSGES